MDELELFDNIYEALGAIVLALGGAKKVGKMLWPDETMERASQNVNDRLNSNRRELFSPQQVIFLLKKARDVNYHAGMRWISGECGYTGTRPADRDEQKADLQRQFVHAASILQNLGEQLKRMDAV